jgi:hypothetical protein
MGGKGLPLEAVRKSQKLHSILYNSDDIDLSLLPCYCAASTKWSLVATGSWSGLVLVVHLAALSFKDLEQTVKCKVAQRAKDI